MAETANSLVSDILREIYVQADEQQIESIDFEVAARYVNRFMAELSALGIDIPWVDIENPADTIYAPSGAISGIIANVAVNLCGQYDVNVSAPLAAAAERGMQAMRHLGVNIGKQNFPSTLPIGSGNENWLDNDSHFFPDYSEDENGPY